MTCGGDVDQYLGIFEWVDFEMLSDVATSGGMVVGEIPLWEFSI